MHLCTGMIIYRSKLSSVSQLENRKIMKMRKQKERKKERELISYKIGGRRSVNRLFIFSWLIVLEVLQFHFLVNLTLSTLVNSLIGMNEIEMQIRAKEKVLQLEK